MRKCISIKIVRAVANCRLVLFQLNMTTSKQEVLVWRNTQKRWRNGAIWFESPPHTSPQHRHLAEPLEAHRQSHLSPLVWSELSVVSLSRRLSSSVVHLRGRGRPRTRWEDVHAELVVAAGLVWLDPLAPVWSGLLRSVLHDRPCPQGLFSHLAPVLNMGRCMVFEVKS